ncbi:MAG: hypothetical protein L6R35_000109 [Caloplaca aegaea]|nr:MAG: hypothetical protein L6R35_000109 [Caloplaca aegaea]
MVDGLTSLRHYDVDKSELRQDDLPRLEEATIGNPIAHAQVITLSKLLKEACTSHEIGQVSFHLDDLLRGSVIYNDPPKPREEPTDEYKALMARLRREEEARAYERMINPPRATETFEQRFPNSSNSKLFSDHQAQVAEDDEMTYADINRQMALIINILVSIVACSVALWLVAGSWSVPSRLALSMGGSILIAVAEAVVYAGYLRRVKEAREKGKKHVEIKEIIKTWAIGADNEKPLQLNEDPRATQKGPDGAQVRKRNVKPG